MFPVSFIPRQNTSVCPIVLNNVVPSEDSKIMIQSPVIVDDCKENRVTHISEAPNYVNEFIAVFEGG